MRLGSGEQIEAKDRGKDGWESMQRDDQSGCIRRTSIVRQPLIPGQTPMRALRSGPDFLRGGFCAWWRERSGTFQADGLVADHFQPGSPDATTWPVAPEHWSGSRRCAGCLRGGVEESERVASSGQSTALTRRGFSVVLLS